MKIAVCIKHVLKNAAYNSAGMSLNRDSVPGIINPNDRVALETLARLFPRRRVIGIHAVDLVWGLGTVHCMTQQQPA